MLTIETMPRNKAKLRAYLKRDCDEKKTFDSRGLGAGEKRVFLVKPQNRR